MNYFKGFTAAEKADIKRGTAAAKRIPGTCVIRMLVSPALAKKLMKHNTVNRLLRSGVMEKYSRDMKAGVWTESPDMISFYLDGTVANGQHRLQAIIDSGVPVILVLQFGLSKEAGLNVDTPALRSFVDNLRISSSGKEVISKRAAVTATSIHLGTRAPRDSLSFHDKAKILETYDEAVVWVEMNAPKGRHLNGAPIRASIGRAYYSVDDLDRLAHFCKVLQTGIMRDPKEDLAAHTLREWLKDKCSNHPTSKWDDVYLKTSYAIAAFMSRRPISRIVTPESPKEKYGRPTKREIASVKKQFRATISVSARVSLH